MACATHVHTGKVAQGGIYPSTSPSDNALNMNFEGALTAGDRVRLMEAAVRNLINPQYVV